MIPIEKAHLFSTARRSNAHLSVLLFLSLVLTSAHGADLSSARVSEVIQDVRLLPASAASRPAVVNDNVGVGTAVRTGTQSRAELTFKDLTVTRLGENTVFSFKQGTRDVDVEHGSILVEVPRGSAAANIRTGVITAAITGGTALFGSGPPAKFMVLEGVGTFYPAGHPGDAVTLHGGEMASLGPGGHLLVQTFNVKLVLETSHLIVGFPSLANLPLILAVIDQQIPPLFIPPTKDVTDVTSQAIAASMPPPSAPPSEFGPPPPIINSPNPYVITSRTTITTDPTITTKGVTNYGKIWRGDAIDGPLSQFVFGSTSSFDTASGFDNQINSEAGSAVFKFTSLVLTGDPVIDTTAGGQVNLALVAVNSITSSGLGGTLTFAGIRGLLLATEDGPITLGSDISFSGLRDINFYAGGSGSNLTLGSPISASSRIRLFAEGTIQVNGNESAPSFRAFSGGDFLVGSGVVSAANIEIESLSNINIDPSKFLSPAGGGHSIVLDAAGTLTIGGGSLSANALMKFFATGSSGAIDFTANVTLTCRAAAIILAANTITINDNVVVTIGGSFPASVYANIANYSGSGGNGSTTGTFAGAGASNPHPLGSLPSSAITTVQNSSSTTVATSGSARLASHRGHRSSLTDGVKPLTHSVTSAHTTTSNTIKVANSDQLLSVLDSATPGSNGKLAINSSKADGVSKHPNQNNLSNAALGSRHDRSAADSGASSKAPIVLAQSSRPLVR